MVSTSRRASLWALWQALVVTLILLWLAQPIGYVLRANEGHDFILLYAAARALRDLQNPYDPAILVRNAHLAGLPWAVLLDNHQLVTQPYVYPPLFAWLVIPLTYLRPMTALTVWRAISTAAMLAGTYGLTALWSQPGGFLGSRGRRILFAGIVAAAPVTVMAQYWGNPVVLVYAAMGGWVWALTRGQTWADVVAGALMSIAILKLQLALPLALLAALCLLQGSDAWTRRRLVAYGFAGACACWLALDLLVTGPAMLLAWPHSMLYLSSMISMQMDMPSLMGLLELGLSGLAPSLTTKATIMVLVWTTLALVALYWRLRRVTPPAALLALLSIVWCFGAPYGHANDEILLVPGALFLLAALDGLPGRWAHRGRARGARLRSSAREVVSVGLTALALGLLYLGGSLHFIFINGYELPFFMAALVILVLLVAVWVALPAFRCEVDGAKATAEPALEAGPKLAATRPAGTGYVRRFLLRGSMRS